MFSFNKILKIIKLFVDISLAIFLLVFLSPLFLIISLVILIDTGSPIFFIQKRIGMEGKLFSMFKFRTMKNNTASKGSKYHCYEGDIRITYSGRYLRKYSLDELPQLLNIILLQMSFVGPRPPIHDELGYENINPKLYGILKERTTVRPGITGYAQVKSRNDLDWNEKLILDKEYLSLSQKKRFIEDIIIVMKTLLEIIFTKGAYDKKVDNYPLK